MKDVTASNQELTEEYKLAYSERYREIILNNICVSTITLINSLQGKKEDPDNPVSVFEKQVSEQLADDLMAVCALASSMKIMGRPKSLILINQFGEAIDLLKITDLSEQDAYNELIDNLTRKNS